MVDLAKEEQQKEKPKKRRTTKKEEPQRGRKTHSVPLRVASGVLAFVMGFAMAIFPNDIRSWIIETWKNTKVTIEDVIDKWKEGKRKPPPGPCPSDSDLPTMILIPEDDFEMGYEEKQEEHKTTHSVHLKSFTISCHLITSEQYNSYLQDTGKEIQKCTESDCSVQKNLSWQDAMSYTAWLSEKTKKQYCLPTVAQWESAARFFEPQSQTWEWTCSPSDDKYDGKEQECLSIEETEERVAVRSIDSSQKGMKEIKRGGCRIDAEGCNTREIGFRVVNSENTCPKQPN